jgi:cytochrome b561
MLHWLLAALVFITIALSFAALLAGSPRAAAIARGWHNAFGIACWPIAFLLVAWRTRGTPPLPEPTMFRWQRNAASTVRYLIYVLLITLPILGVLAASAQSEWLRFFTSTFVPSLPIWNWPRAASVIVVAHRVAGWLLVVLLILHVGVAIYHHRVVRDRMLERILPMRSEDKTVKPFGGERIQI